MSGTRQTTRDIQAQHTKKNIWETAISLIRKVGYNQVTIEDITKAAGVSKGTFYLYFDTKDAVLAEQFSELDRHYCNTIKNLPAEPVDRQLLYFIQQMCMYCQNVCGLNIMKTLYMNQISTELRTQLLNNKERPFFTIMTNFVYCGRTSGLFRSDIDEDELTTILIRAVHGLIYDWCLYDAEFDLVEESKVYMKYTLEMIKAPS
ncbi:MAG: TetR/AcrR family transcriptional regulator [Clostridium sp.]|nr:TetR/AcrR family transcriptional regulator [Clostridium sp.]